MNKAKTTAIVLISIGTTVGCELVTDFTPRHSGAAGGGGEAGSESTSEVGGRGSRGGGSSLGGSMALGGNASQGGSTTKDTASSSSVGGALTGTGGGGAGGTSSSSTSSVGATSGGTSGSIGGSVAGGASPKGGSSSVTLGGATAKGGSSAVTLGGAGTTGGTSAKGGTTSRGGSTASGGAGTIGGTTSVGGTTSRGGSTSVGGTTATSTAAGGAASGGATATTPTKRFLGGPCLVSRDSYGAAIIYARGDDNHVYAYQYVLSTAGGIATIPWRQVSGIDASSLVADSDLDCAGYPTTHIAALGTMPANSILHTSGTDISFMAFYNTGLETAATTSRAPNTPGISGGGNGAYDFVIAKTNLPLLNISTSFTFYESTNATVKSWSPTLTKSLDSGTDADSNGTNFAAYTSDGYLMRIHGAFNMGFLSWDAAEYFPPPTGTSFQYSPTICNGGVFVTAGNRLWRLNTLSLTWDKVSDKAVASGPDCVGNNFGWNVVALTSAGTILYGYELGGTTGGAATAFVDLGSY